MLVTEPKTWRRERLGWRDQALSDRHGKWGFNCPAVDIDFLLIEYDLGEPRGLVDYKHENVGALDIGHSNYRALVRLADGYRYGPLPCWIAVYSRDGWRFRVKPLNSTASIFFRLVDEDRWLSERDYVRYLYLLRSGGVLRASDSAVLAKLNG